MNCEHQIRQLKSEIAWLQDKLDNEKMSEKKRKTYEHQIKHKELVIAMEETTTDINRTEETE